MAPGPVARARLLYHTLRWLRWRQLVGQLRQRLRRAFERPAAWRARARPSAPPVRWEPRQRLRAPGPQQRPEDLLAGAFCFLRRREQLGWPPSWDNPALPRLWQYNLHYFEYLWALPFEEARRIARDWIRNHALERGRVGWEPYPTSLRLTNWCSYFFGEFRAQTEADAELREELAGSAALQADWLARRLETHLLGNHLLENAVALACCGTCFGGAVADAWLRRAHGILVEELAEQVLPDGGHIERSPMYQARLVHALGLLRDTGQPELVALVSAPLERMRAALARLCHPDGEIALLNDAAIGIAPPPAELLGDSPSWGCFALPDTGYYGSRTPEGHYLVADAGPIGPDYQPGHAHGDLFSFELSLGGRRVVVDAGVEGYEVDAMRRYVRSTRAHNTVEVEGQDQCEFWSAFRVGRRARPRDVRWTQLEDGFQLEAWHDGYERLPGRPRHRRRLRWFEDGVLLVRDVVTASRPVSVRSHLHLHPDCEVEEIDALGARVRYPAGHFVVRVAGEGKLGEAASSYCPEFGMRLENRVLVLEARGERIEIGFCIANGAGSLGYALGAGADVGGRRYSW